MRVLRNRKKVNSMMAAFCRLLLAKHGNSLSVHFSLNNVILSCSVQPCLSQKLRARFSMATNPLIGPSTNMTNCSLDVCSCVLAGWQGKFSPNRIRTNAKYLMNSGCPRSPVSIRVKAKLNSPSRFDDPETCGSTLCPRRRRIGPWRDIRLSISQNKVFKK